MLSRLELLIDLLHSVANAALATHSTMLDGYPFASQGQPVRIRFSAGPVTRDAWLPTYQRELAAMVVEQGDAAR